MVDIFFWKRSGIELAIEKNLEDILQCLCAKENGCGYLIKSFMIVVSKLWQQKNLLSMRKVCKNL